MYAVVDVNRNCFCLKRRQDDDTSSLSIHFSRVSIDKCMDSDVLSSQLMGKSQGAMLVIVEIMPDHKEQQLQLLFLNAKRLRDGRRKHSTSCNVQAFEIVLKRPTRKRVFSDKGNKS
ncbi:hypothetical protein EGR_05511 [Echinococcus granulosus]|uniref:Uncharacterized protein n=1 Tax=Echinococcus granulosus TaxID=6210 RepID=W6UN53_ECHGR|nr:hypothetical protein EGR_05511 [Echinococcus granulosus]EUB59612.1 hypothetical protein EGR_05511 [Echinococcus granulosus]